MNQFSIALPAGLQLVSATIRLPTVSPYRWSAEKSADQLLIQGYVPSDTVRDIILGAARRAAGALSLKEEQALALGAPTGFDAAIVAALRQMELAKKGKISLIDNKLSVFLEVDDAALAERIRAALASASLGGLSLALDLSVAAPVQTPALVLPPIVPVPLPSLPSPAEAAKPVLTPEASQCQDKLKRLVDDQVILFDNGRDTIRSESLPTLDQVVLVLKDCAITSLIIEGHTDNVGSPEFNMTLSHARANAVKAYLLDKGVRDNLLKEEGFGETRPVADNDSDAGRARNRRIEFTVKQ